LDEEERALRAGDTGAQRPHWEDLRIGSMIYQFTELEEPRP
jgi:hypothetical protein